MISRSTELVKRKTEIVNAEYCDKFPLFRIQTEYRLLSKNHRLVRFQTNKTSFTFINTLHVGLIVLNCDFFDLAFLSGDATSLTLVAVAT